MSRLLCCAVLLLLTGSALAATVAQVNFTLDAPSPHMVRAISASSPALELEFERQPAIARFQRDWDSSGRQLFRHDAQPATRYRYRARAAAINTNSAGPWSPWQTIRTPPASSAAPRAPTDLVGTEGDLVIELSWSAEDPDMNGFLLERCDADGLCQPAALLHPDLRRFQFHTTRANVFRLAAFNEHGISAQVSTPMLGRDLPIQPATATPPRVEDSLAAREISKHGFSDGYYCTSPAELLDEGWTLIGIRGEEDLYQNADGCGTGGCVYHRFQTIDGCYRAAIGYDQGGVLSTTPPYRGVNETTEGIVITNSSGSATDGLIIIYRGGEEIDSYRWQTRGEPFIDQLPPFPEIGDIQSPGN
ncbi:MAG: hypothetical protein IPK97_01975 [Ahniella sp.]|nr:hypothetical protein [Ahniella sp.]